MTEHTLRLGIDSRPAERGGRRTTGALDEVRRAANRASSSVDRLKKEFEGLQRIGEGMRRFGTIVTIGVTLPLAALATGAVLASAQLDSLERGMIAVSGSTRAAQQEINRLKEVARLPGLGFREAIQGSINLQAAGLSADLARDALIGFGNALATVGRGAADLQLVNLALGQIASKGRVSAEEIRQIAERVPQIRQVMIEAFGTASTEELAAQGIAAEEFIRRVTDALLELDRVSGGIRNSLENIQDAAFRAADALGDQLLPVIGPIIDGLTSMLEDVRQLSPEIVRWGIALGATAAVAGPLVFVLGSLTTAVTALAAALGVGLLPIIIAGGPLLLAVGALSTLLIKLGLDAATARAEADALAASLRDLSDATPAELGSIEGRLEQRQQQLIQRLGALRDDISRLPEGRLRDEVERVATNVLRDLNAVNNRLETVRQGIVDATRLEPITIEVARRQVGGLDLTIADLGQVAAAIGETRSQIDDIRFQLSSVFERDVAESEELRAELVRLEEQLVRLEAARNRLVQERGPIIDLVEPQELIRPEIERIDLNRPPIPPPDTSAVETAWEEAVRGIQQTFANGFAQIFTDGLDGFDDFAEQVLDVFVRLAAQIAAALAIERLGIDQIIRDIRAGSPADAALGVAGTAGTILKYGGAAAVGAGVGYSTGNPLLGAASGAAAGFALGGPPAAVLGAVVGGLSSLFSDSEAAAQAQRRAAEEMQRAALAAIDLNRSIERAFSTQQRDPLGDRFLNFVLQKAGQLEPDIFAEAAKTGIFGLTDPREVLARVDEILNPTGPGRHAVPREGTALRDFFEFILTIGDQFLAAAKQREQQFRESLDVRELVAKGDTDAADRLRQDIRQEAELERARALGFDEATIERLKYVHGLEDEALATKQAADAIRDATSALNSPSGLRISLLRWRATLDQVVPIPEPEIGEPGGPGSPGGPFDPPPPYEPPPEPDPGLPGFPNNPPFEPPPPYEPGPPTGPLLPPIQIETVNFEIVSNGDEDEVELAHKVQRGLVQIALRGGGDPNEQARR